MLNYNGPKDYPNVEFEYPESSTIEFEFSEQEPFEKGYYKVRWEVSDDYLSGYYWYWDGYYWYYDSTLGYRCTDSPYSWIGLNYDPN